MADLTGSALLDTVLDLTGASVSPLFQSALTQRLQDAMDAGITSNMALAAVLGASAPIKASVPSGNPLLELMNVVGDAKDIIDNLGSVIDIDIDTGTLETPVLFDAGDDAFNFIDDASVLTSVIIDNFSDDDTLTFLNADVSDYFFANDGEDVMLSLNYNDEGTMNVITLTGVVTSEDLVSDAASFVAAVGFDPFVS